MNLDFLSFQVQGQIFFGHPSPIFPFIDRGTNLKFLKMIRKLEGGRDFKQEMHFNSKICVAMVDTIQNYMGWSLKGP